MKVVFMLIFIGTLAVLTEARPNEIFTITAETPSFWEKIKAGFNTAKEKVGKYATVENAQKAYSFAKPVLNQLCKDTKSKKCRVIQGLPDGKQQDPNEDELPEESEEGDESTSSSILSIKNAKKIYHHVAKPVADKLCEGSDSKHCRVVKGLPAGRVVVTDDDESNEINGHVDNDDDDNDDDNSQIDYNDIPE